MSGPNSPPMNDLFNLFGGGQAKKGPLPTLPLGQTKKRMGDDRVPMNKTEVPYKNPGQVQDAAARKLGVRPEQVQPQASNTPRPLAPPVQAPKTPSPAPEQPQPPVQAPTLPQPLDREPNPSPVSGIPLPRPKPLGADVGSMLGQLGGADAQSGPPAAMVKALENKIGGMSSAQAAPSPPPTSPFDTGAPPIQVSPDMLAKTIAAAKIKAQAERPPVPPQQPPSDTVTPPVPPGQPPAPPPASGEGPSYAPSVPSFQGYELRPSAKETKGEEKHGKVLKKENNPYYYTRIGVRPGDNAGVAQRLREVRAKAENPRTAKKMTQEEDRILAQYNEKDSYLMSMLPEDIQKRMQQYKTGNLVGQIPDRYDDRPPGVTQEAGKPTPLKLPPKSAQKVKVDPAEEQAKDAIDNPPPANGLDDSGSYTLREE